MDVLNIVMMAICTIVLWKGVSSVNCSSQIVILAQTLPNVRDVMNIPSFMKDNVLVHVPMATMPQKQWMDHSV